MDRRSAGAPAPSPSRPLVAVLAASAAVFAVLFALVHGDHTAALDDRAFRLLGGSRDGVLHAVARPLAIAAPIVLLAAVALAARRLIARGVWREAAVVVAGVPLSFIAARIGKAIERRPRPHGPLLHAGGYAFPSTDSAVAIGAFALAVVVARTVDDSRHRRAIVLAGAVVSVATGLLFVALRVHFLSDVFAGWALGLVAFSLCGLLAQSRASHT